MNKIEKVKKLEGLLKLWLNDSPFKIDGLFFNQRQMAERIVNELEDEEDKPETPYEPDCFEEAKRLKERDL